MLTVLGNKVCLENVLFLITCNSFVESVHFIFLELFASNLYCVYLLLKTLRLYVASQLSFIPRLQSSFKTGQDVACGWLAVCLHNYWIGC